MPRCLAMAARPIVAVRRLISAASMLAGRPLYFPSLLALAMPSRWRSSMISRSQVATPARMVSISFNVGLRVSSRLPPMGRITRPTACITGKSWQTSRSTVSPAAAPGHAAMFQCFSQRQSLPRTHLFHGWIQIQVAALPVDDCENVGPGLLVGQLVTQTTEYFVGRELVNDMGGAGHVGGHIECTRHVAGSRVVAGNGGVAAACRVLDITQIAALQQFSGSSTGVE